MKEAFMRSLFGRWLLRWVYRKVNEGDVEPVLKLLRPDVEFVFPGTNRWGRTYRGKAEVEGFIRELVELGLQFKVHDVVVKGWPWNMTIYCLISDEATDSDGRVTYANRAVEIWKARWGLIASGEVFEDTEKATAWDAQLSARA
jgi:ketosteroid isomerase-like protein